MAKPIVLKVKVAWWYRWLYCPALVWFIVITRKYINRDVTYNKERFNYWTKKATKVEAKPT